MKQNKNILCVDDNPEHLELTKVYFEVNDFKVTTCSTAEECFEHLENNDFALVILDAWLAAKDGFDICHEIRINNQMVRIVFFTADASPKSREKAMRAGADAYLVKPDDLDKIVSTAKNLIEAAVN